VRGRADTIFLTRPLLVIQASLASPSNSDDTSLDPDFYPSRPLRASLTIPAPALVSYQELGSDFANPPHRI
jgi:hypothetical protein